jgi:hypothetical protein
MARLAEITALQAQELTGQLYADNQYFNPIEVLGKWYISAEEVRDCVNPEFSWVNELQIVDVEIPIPNEI